MCKGLKKLLIGCDLIAIVNFNHAVLYIEQVYGCSGETWLKVKDSSDYCILKSYLNDIGIKMVLPY